MFGLKVREKTRSFFTLSFIKKIIDSPSRFFVVIAMVAGLIFVITSPPGFGLDERAHFMRTYLISNGQFTPERLPPTNEIGAYLPINLVQFVGTSTADLLNNDTSRFFVNRHDTDLKDYSAFFQQQFSSEMVDDPSTNTQLLAAQAYSSLGYLHMALVTKVTRVLDMPMIYAMYLSRIANLVLYVALIFGAIKVIPRYKWLLVCVGLLPTAIYQASSMSLDPLVTGLSILATAYAVRFWLGKKKAITRREVLIVLGIFIAIALVKTPYACLLLLFIGLPSNRFKSKRVAYIWKSVWITLTFLAALSWVYINRSITPGLVALQPGHASMSQQVQYTLSHPIRVLGILAKTHYESIDHTLSSLLGRAGDRQVGLPNAFLYILFALSTGLTALLYGGSRKDKMAKKEFNMFNLLLAVTAIGLIALVSITLYVTFTPVGATTVQGIQGRYFLPILPIIMILIFRLSNFKIANSPRVLTIVRASSVTLLLSTVLIFYLVNF